jgi:hypothetical protein
MTGHPVRPRLHRSTHPWDPLLSHHLPHLHRPTRLWTLGTPLKQGSRTVSAALAALVLSACSHGPLHGQAHGQAHDQADGQARLDRTLAQLLPTQVLMLGEQHDAPEHQAIHQRTVSTLAARGQLAAVVLEMTSGGSTAGLTATASEAQAQ